MSGVNWQLVTVGCGGSGGVAGGEGGDGETYSFF